MKHALALLLSLAFFNVYSFHLIPYRKGAKWGYADSTGAIVVKPVYSAVSHGGSKVCHIVQLNGKYGVLDSVGKKITELTYDKITFLQDGMGLITTRNGKMGLMDHTGNFLLPNIYDKVEEYPISKEVTFWKGNTRRMYSRTTKKIVSTDDSNDIGEMIEAPSVLASEPVKRIDLRYYVVGAGNKNKIGKEIRTITYRDGSAVRNQVRLDTLSFMFERVIPLNYYKIPAILVANDGKWGVVHEDAIAVPVRYDSVSRIIIGDRCTDFYFQVMMNGKWGLVNIKGNPVSPLDYDEIIHANLMSENSLSCFNAAHGISVKKQDRFGLISIGGQELVPIEQDSIFFDNRRGYYIFRKGDRKGVYAENFQGGLFFSPAEELSELTNLDGTVLMKIIDSKRKSTDIDGYERPFVIGYISAKGIRFFEE
jgi:hypothetical protein